MNYQVKIKKTEEGIAIWCPELPGCASQGATEEEALENIKYAIHDYLEVQRELSMELETRNVEVV
jgi:predicted RNase H-like HicB family nuclease